MFWKMMIFALVLVGIAMLALGIKLLFDRKASFSGGSCQTAPGLHDKGIGCGCGANSCESKQDGLKE